MDLAEIGRAACIPPHGRCRTARPSGTGGGEGIASSARALPAGGNASPVAVASSDPLPLGSSEVAAPFGAMGPAQAFGFDYWPLSFLPFPIACATALLVPHLDREIAVKEAGGGLLAEPPSA